MIFQIANYSFNKNLTEVSVADAINAIDQKIDMNLHARIYDDKPCIVFGDIDYTTDREQIISILNEISNELDIPLNKFKLTLNTKDDFITCHWTIPSYQTDIKTLKQIFKAERFKRFIHKSEDGRTHTQCDNSVYKNGLFRLPYQTTAQKTSIHVIETKAASAVDFLLHEIPVDVKPLIHMTKPEPETELEQTKKDNFDDIRRMALQLGNYFREFDMWIKLGMIIHHEANGKLSGLDLFDEISKEIDGYKSKDDVAKQYYSYTKCKKQLTIASLYLWFYEEFPDEKPPAKMENNIYLKQKEEFQKRVFKLDNPVCFGIENEDFKVQLVTLKDLKIWSKGKYPKIKIDDKIHEFVDLWLEDPDNRTLKNIVFDPKESDDKNYNLYKGSVYTDGEVCDEDCVFLKLLKYISNDATCYEYFKQWISAIVKTPWKKTNVAIVLYSEIGGIGKNCITDALCKLFKNYSAHLESIEDLTKNFNSYLTNKLFIYGDEINANAKKVSDKLKQVITRPTQNLEKKGIDSIELNDYTNYMFTTNNENCFKLDQDDRRYLMVKAPNVPLDKSFYDEFYKFINKPSNMNKVYNYFMKYENSSFNVGTGRAPITKYKQEIMFENYPAQVEMLYKKPNMLFGELFTTTELYEKYKEYAKQNYKSQTVTINKFGLDMKKYLQPFLKRSNGTKYNFINVTLEQLQEHLYKTNKEYYMYINNLDETPTFKAENHKETVKNDLD
jgi:hypothetical protein